MAANKNPAKPKKGKTTKPKQTQNNRKTRPVLRVD